MKKILITGGTGYLGRNLANFYKKKYNKLWKEYIFCGRLVSR